MIRDIHALRHPSADRSESFEMSRELEEGVVLLLRYDLHESPPQNHLHRLSNANQHLRSRITFTAEQSSSSQTEQATPTEHSTGPIDLSTRIAQIVSENYPTMATGHAPSPQPDISRNRLPTLFEVLSRRSLAPVDLFSFYIYMRDQQRSVDYLDFWLVFPLHDLHRENHIF